MCENDEYEARDVNIDVSIRICDFWMGAEWLTDAYRDFSFFRTAGEVLLGHIVWKLLKMSHLNFSNFGIFHQFLSY